MGVGYTSADRPFLSLSETRCESGDSKILDGRVPGQGTKTRGLPEKSHSRLSAQGAPREVELSELVEGPRGRLACPPAHPSATPNKRDERDRCNLGPENGTGGSFCRPALTCICTASGIVQASPGPPPSLQE